MGPEDLIARGFYIFPCRGKRPLVKWTKESTRDFTVIAAWKTKFPNCGWGIDCGKSDLAVLDVDSGKVPSAEDNLADLLINNSVSLPPTFKVRTRSGGYHLYFSGSIKNSASNKLGIGLDTRGAGGFVVAPPSVGYTIDQNLIPAPLPDWLQTLVGRPTEHTAPAMLPGFAYDSAEAVALAIAFLSIASPAKLGEGGNTHIFKIAARVKDYGISYEKNIDLLLEHWYPRCEPNDREDSLARIAANAYTFGFLPPGVADPHYVFPLLSDAEFLACQTPIPSSLFIEGNALLAREIKIDYLIDTLIETPSTGLIFGDPSAGKSFLAIDMALAVACGTSWMKNFAKPGIAVYFAGEGRHGVQRRIAAWRTYYGISIPQNMLWVSEKRIEFTQKSLALVADELHSIQDKTGLPISICHVDTLARHMPSASDENSARDMGGFINAVDWLKDQFNAVVAVVHHSGKMNKETSRGSSAIRGAMDWEMKVDFRSGTRSIIFTKQKESELPPPMGFVLQDVMLGEKVKSAVPLSCTYDPTFGKASNLGSDAGLALSVLQFEISSKGKTAISEKEWRKVFYDALGDNCGEATKRQKFGRARAKLVESATIRYKGDQVSEALVDGGGNDD